MEGGGCGDFVKHCCCPCCALIQEAQQSEKQKGSGGDQYQAPETMNYVGHMWNTGRNEF